MRGILIAAGIGALLYFLSQQKRQQNLLTAQNAAKDIPRDFYI